MSKKAVLLVNLGSPDSTEVGDVKAYLREFLTDERVIDVPFVRKFVVPAIILNTRPKKSAEAYESIWTEEGSPLIAISKRQQDALQQVSNLPIYLAMRYANPSIPDVLQQIIDAGVEQLFLVPLYPHYAMSSYETVVVRVMEVLKEKKASLTVDTLQPFYDHPEYIRALGDHTREYLGDDYDKVVFSYHGIPERHVKVSDPSKAHCLCSADCCERANPAHATCYRHQCFRTTQLVADYLEIPAEKRVLSFQSRLGRDPWLAPATDATLSRLGKEGVKKLRILCPAFITDCLETLEEIAEEGKETFLTAGGEDFQLIPCLNESPRFVEFLRHRIAEWENGAKEVPPRGPLATAAK
jgi:ferrochelatase